MTPASNSPPPSRFKDKIRAYWHYLQQNLHTDKFGIKSFRMLTVTRTDERAENLCALATTILPERARKYYLFTSLKNFSLEEPASILDSVYLSPKAATSPATRYPLFPPLPSQTETPDPLKGD